MNSIKKLQNDLLVKYERNKILKEITSVNNIFFLKSYKIWERWHDGTHTYQQCNAMYADLEGQRMADVITLWKKFEKLEQDITCAV